MLDLHPAEQLVDGPLVGHVGAEPPRRVPDANLRRPGVLLRVALEGEDRVVVAQEGLMVC